MRPNQQQKFRVLVTWTRLHILVMYTILRNCDTHRLRGSGAGILAHFQELRAECKIQGIASVELTKFG